MDKTGWIESAYANLRGFARGNRRAYELRGNEKPFTIEQMRGCLAQISGLTPPADERWWGPVVQRALREKIIRRKGFAPAKSSHGALKARYVGTRFA